MNRPPPLPLDAPSPTLQLHAITANGPGRRFDPKPGLYTLRVRPRGALESGRVIPVSNAITITLKPLPAVQTRAQEVSFAAAPGYLRFTNRPAGDQALIRQMLARPPQVSGVPLVAHSTALQVLPPLPFYDLRLPQTQVAPDPALPATSNSLRYLVQRGDEFAASINLQNLPGGPAFVAMGSDRSDGRPLAALQELAAMDAVRTADYEPRLLRVTDESRRQSQTVIWLHSSAGKPEAVYHRGIHGGRADRAGGEPIKSCVATCHGVGANALPREVAAMWKARRSCCPWRSD